MTYWGLLLGLPLLAFGGVLLVSPASARLLTERFEQSKIAAVVLTVVAWGWTSYEVAGYDVNIFREFLGGVRSPFKILVDILAFGFDHFWAVAPVLAYLTVIWMPKNLPVRAVTALLMLFPALMFRATRHLVPEAGFSPVHVFVATAYIAAVIGMYGMFYPWRIEKVLAFLEQRDGFSRAFGAVLALWGVALAAAGFFT